MSKKFHTFDESATQGDKVIVSIVEVKGSAPRETGAELVVYAQSEAGTIGGGSMEYEAIAQARAMLERQAAYVNERFAFTRLSRFRLDPAFDQCCGGAVVLLYEYIPAEPHNRFNEEIEVFAKRRRPVCLLRLAKFDQTTAAQAMLVGEEGVVATSIVDEAVRIEGADLAAEYMLPNVSNRSRVPNRSRVSNSSRQVVAKQGLIKRQNGEHWVVSVFKPTDFNITLFGAGHVGHALVKILADLPCQINWIDNRADIFPRSTAPNVSCIRSATPAAEITDSPAGSYFLVMTHSHSLDFELCDHILTRDDFNYLGLIGSSSKSLRFRKQFAKRGLRREEIDKITCPIGIQGIHSKQPAAIAISVAAELLSIYEADRGKKASTSDSVIAEAQLDTI